MSAVEEKSCDPPVESWLIAPTSAPKRRADDDAEGEQAQKLPLSNVNSSANEQAPDEAERRPWPVPIRAAWPVVMRPETFST